MKYPKINGVFKRDKRGQFTDEFALSEFEDLLYVPWTATEKVDGTNIRIYEDEIRGRTDNADIPARLFTHLLTLPRPKSGLVYYGEGYGGKIQAGGSYSPVERFILFDVFTGTRWLPYEELHLFGLPVVPELPTMTLVEWIVRFQHLDFPQSALREGYAEGIVLKPQQGYLDRYGHPIITKLKVKDFENR